MPRKPYDPLAMLPSPDAIRQRLTETLTLAERLRILLEVSERVHKATSAQVPADPGLRPPSADLLPTPAELRRRLSVSLQETTLIRRLIRIEKSTRHS